MIKLTVRDIEAAIAAQRSSGIKPRKLTADTGLRLRIAKDGTATWLVLYMFDGREREYRLPEPYGNGKGHCSLASARERAAEIRSKARSGIDYQVEKADELAALERQREAEAAEHARRMNRQTVKALFERWDGLVLSKRKGAEEVRRGWNKDVLTIIGAMYAEEVRRADIMNVIDSVMARGANRLANRLLAEMRQMFGFAVVREIVANDPTSGIQKRHAGGREEERDRTLSDDELRALPLALDAAGMTATTKHAVWLILATSVRVGELVKARKSDIDLDAGVWRIPAENAKNDDAHTVYLSEFAIIHMQSLIQASASEEWLMPARKKDGTETHADPKGITKQISDRQLRFYHRAAHSNRTKHENALVLGAEKWTPHDLRRTSATLMQSLGVLPAVIEACLNHREQNRMKRTYQRYDYAKEKLDAWQRLGQRLKLYTLPDSNVVFLHQRQA
ncbi:tyrosine-type recombinase/integrase [Paraburkholderia strydomiana]|uniref:tyrosine-type recombinase/integrase n=1 Tax=Paraburkholderia strydomiana TaxID=1245417 RepID=UPI001BEB408F|nr:site-specific integrase [Paraburkholderia strydomiana]MBT2791207.1 tyrosine-type recombinase/integrase [Paraburkholderia strydomiana]